MIPTHLRLALAVGLAVSGSVAAHFEFQNDDWCTQGVIQYTGPFALTHNELAAALQEEQAAVANCAQARSTPDSSGDAHCGIFDPPGQYQTARRMARAACGAVESSTGAPDNSVVAFILEPQSFNDRDHHETFNFDVGVSGICGICLPHRPPPIVSPVNHN